MAKAKKTNNRTALACALEYLARREYSAYELTCRLSQRSYRDADIQAALEYCQHHNWQSDDRFADMYIRSCLERGKGWQYIVQGLYARGIDRNQAELALENQQVDWTALAQQVYAKRYADKPLRNVCSRDYQRTRQKRLRYLVSQGFDYDQALAALKQSETPDD